MSAALRFLFIWLGFFVSVWSVGVARAQSNLICGSLEFRAAQDRERKFSSGGEWFVFQVFRRTSREAIPVLPGTQLGSVPSARCVGGAVLAVSYFPLSGDPVVVLVLQDGDHLISFLSEDAYSLQGDAIILPSRPLLPNEMRGHLPEIYRSLFDFGPRRGKFG